MPPSYNDMYRAAQDATRDLRDAVGRLSSQLSNLSSQVNSTANNQPQYNSIQRALTDVRYSLTQLFKSNSAPGRATAEQQYMLQALHRIEMRMAALEGFAKDVSDYLRAQRELQRESDDFERPARSRHHPGK